MRVAAKPEQRAYCPWQQQEGWSVRLKSCPAQAKRAAACCDPATMRIAVESSIVRPD
jgi:hypothetical protein